MDRSKFQEWLEGKPPIWAVAIAARAALRAAPLDARLDRSLNANARMRQATLFRALSAAWSVAAFPDTHQMLQVSVRSAELHSNDILPMGYSSIGAAAIACSAARLDSGAKSAAAISIEYALLSIYEAIQIDVSSEVGDDQEFLKSFSGDADKAAVSLAHSKLWTRSFGPIATRWSEVKAELLRTVAREEARGMGPHLDAAERRRLIELEAENWGVWTDWYDRRLRGDPPNEALEIERVTSPAIPWAQGPRAVNKVLREIEEKHARKPPGAELVKPQALRLAAMPALSETAAEGLARQIDDWISACLRESEANALPDELLALEALPAILRRMSKAVHAEGGTEALEATIAAMAVEIARLKADLALAKNAPAESLFWTSFRKKAGESLGDWKMWGALASGGYLLLGPQIGGGALSDLIAMIRPSAP